MTHILHSTIKHAQLPSRSLLGRFVPLVAICAITSVPSHAQDVGNSAPQRAQIDWLAAARDVQAELPQLLSPSTRQPFGAQHEAQIAKRIESYTVKEGVRVLADIGALVAPVYPRVTEVPIPVLAPLNTENMLVGRQRAKGAASLTKQSVFGASIEAMQFLPGPSGYDAIVTVSSKALRELNIPEAYKPQIDIAGTALSYGGDDSGALVAELQGRFPGLRKVKGVEEVTFAFRKYGVSYFLNISCLPDPSKIVGLTCKQAEAIARMVLQDLRLIGGAPLAFKRRSSIPTSHPTIVSADFRYYPPGDLMPGTSEANKGGSTQRVEYGVNLLFPIKEAPNFANSQVFMHWGNCLGQRPQ